MPLGDERGSIIMIRNSIIFACFCMLSVAVSAGTDVTYGATAPQTNTITTDGMAGIRVGMTRRQIAHRLGEHINFGCWETDFGKVSIDRGVVELVQTESPRLATLSGARVGMSERALRRLYPRGLEVPRPDDPYGRYYYHSMSGNSLRFQTSEGKIADITAGKRDAVMRDSYCS